MERHNNFDLLRLVAALSVIFSHAFLLAENSQDHDPLMILTGGQAILGLAGVFVFFTISGYLITQSFETTPSPVVFLAKRALRIFPGLLGCLLVCTFAIGPLVTALPLAEYLIRPETYLFLLHNAVLDVEYNRLPGVVFWPGNIGGIVDGPLWSLPCEALLYLMLFGLGVCRLLTLPVALLLLAAGIAALWFACRSGTHRRWVHDCVVAKNRRADEQPRHFRAHVQSVGQSDHGGVHRQYSHIWRSILAADCSYTRRTGDRVDEHGGRRFARRCFWPGAEQWNICGRSISRKYYDVSPAVPSGHCVGQSWASPRGVGQLSNDGRL